MTRVPIDLGDDNWQRTLVGRKGVSFSAGALLAIQREANRGWVVGCCGPGKLKRALEAALVAGKAPVVSNAPE